MFAPNDYLLAGILFLALLFLLIDLWRFENGRDFAKKRLSHYSLSGRWQAPAAVLPPEGWQRARRARGQRARPLEGPKGPRVAKTCESEGPKGPRTSKAKCPSRSLPVLLYVFHNSAQNREIHGPFSRP